MSTKQSFTPAEVFTKVLTPQEKLVNKFILSRFATNPDEIKVSVRSNGDISFREQTTGVACTFGGLDFSIDILERDLQSSGYIITRDEDECNCGKCDTLSINLPKTSPSSNEAEEKLVTKDYVFYSPDAILYKVILQSIHGKFTSSDFDNCDERTYKVECSGKNHQRNLVMIAAHLGLVKPLRAMMKCDSMRTLTNSTDETGMTPLLLAAENCDSPDHVQCVRMLLENSANVNVQEKDGYTPLMFTVTFCNHPCRIECMRVLLENKALVNIRNKHNFTALSNAEATGSIECAKILKEEIQRRVEML